MQHRWQTESTHIASSLYLLTWGFEGGGDEIVAWLQEGVDLSWEEPDTNWWQMRWGHWEDACTHVKVLHDSGDHCPHCSLVNAVAQCSSIQSAVQTNAVLFNRSCSSANCLGERVGFPTHSQTRGGGGGLWETSLGLSPFFLDVKTLNCPGQMKLCMHYHCKHKINLALFSEVFKGTPAYHLKRSRAFF